tara:strand:- start:340 stop:921 length:582 start_codon:yes stop_codon:yes gene_type:complete
MFLLGCLIVSCARNSSEDSEEKDTSELYSKSQQIDEIIKRSGTKLDPDSEIALSDAENRLRTGGGLFGKKGITFEFLQDEFNEKNTASVGLPVNAILWKSSLDVVSFMPISSADPLSGVIITDWYSAENIGERCKLNVFVKGMELKSSNIEVNSFCQKRENDIWVDMANNESDDGQIENAILNQAKKIKLSVN